MANPSLHKGQGQLHPRAMVDQILAEDSPSVHLQEIWPFASRDARLVLHAAFVIEARRSRRRYVVTTLAFSGSLLLCFAIFGLVLVGVGTWLSQIVPLVLAFGLTMAVVWLVAVLYSTHPTTRHFMQALEDRREYWQSRQAILLHLGAFVRRHLDDALPPNTQ